MELFKQLINQLFNDKALSKEEKKELLEDNIEKYNKAIFGTVMHSSDIKILNEKIELMKETIKKLEDN